VHCVTLASGCLGANGASVIDPFPGVVVSITLQSRNPITQKKIIEMMPTKLGLAQFVLD